MAFRDLKKVGLRHEMKKNLLGGGCYSNWRWCKQAKGEGMSERRSQPMTSFAYVNTILLPLAL